MYYKQGRYKEASDLLHTYLIHQPDDQDALKLLNSLQSPMDAFETEIMSAPVIPPEPDMEISQESSDISEKEPIPETDKVILAEKYVDQGRLLDAISIYENIIEQNPDDDSSKERLEELMAMMSADKEPEPLKVDEEKAKKEKLISTLESWLSAIQEDSKSGISPT